MKHNTARISIFTNSKKYESGFPPLLGPGDFRFDCQITEIKWKRKNNAEKIHISHIFCSVQAQKQVSRYKLKSQLVITSQ